MKLCIVYKVVFLFVLNWFVMVVYLFKLVIYYRNISRWFLSGVWVEFFVDVWYKMFDIFCWVYIEEIFFFRFWIFILLILKKVLNLFRWKWEIMFLVYFFCLCFFLGIFCYYRMIGGGGVYVKLLFLLFVCVWWWLLLK